MAAPRAETTVCLVLGRARVYMLVAGALAALATVGVLGALADGHGRAAGKSRAHAAALARPNVVFILTDDLAWNLVTSRYMPHVVALERQGTTFSNYFVTDSLCCPSRSSIFTGLVPHNTRVFKNKGSQGGYKQFFSRGLERQTYAVAMQPAGYMTSMLGKFLNGYGEPTMTTHIPPRVERLACDGQGLPRVQLRPQRERQGRPLRRPAAAAEQRRQLLHRRDVGTRNAVHQPRRGSPQAVRDGGRDIRAAQALHPGTAERRRLPRPARPARAVVQRAQHRSAAVAWQQATTT